MITNHLHAALIRAGHKKSGLSPNSTVVGFVREALDRMGYLKKANAGRNMISAHLIRWNTRFKQWER